MNEREDLAGRQEEQVTQDVPMVLIFPRRSPQTQTKHKRYLPREDVEAALRAAFDQLKIALEGLDGHPDFPAITSEGKPLYGDVLGPLVNDLQRKPEDGPRCCKRKGDDPDPPPQPRPSPNEEEDEEQRATDGK